MAARMASGMSVVTLPMRAGRSSPASDAAARARSAAARRSPVDIAITEDYSFPPENESTERAVTRWTKESPSTLICGRLQSATRCGERGAMTSGVESPYQFNPDSTSQRYGWPLAATNRHRPQCATSHLSSAYPKSAEHTVLRDKPPRALQVKCSNRLSYSGEGVQTSAAGAAAAVGNSASAAAPPAQTRSSALQRSGLQGRLAPMDAEPPPSGSSLSPLKAAAILVVVRGGNHRARGLRDPCRDGAGRDAQQRGHHHDDDGAGQHHDDGAGADDHVDHRAQRGTHAATTTTTVAHSTVSVVVANATTTNGLAAHYSTVIGAGGWNMQAPADASTSETTSAVYYAAGQQQAAASIATTIGVKPSQVLPISSSTPVSATSRRRRDRGHRPGPGREPADARPLTPDVDPPSAPSPPSPALPAALDPLAADPAIERAVPRLRRHALGHRAGPGGGPPAPRRAGAARRPGARRFALVAVISGRPTGFLRDVLGSPAGVELAGLYGLERALTGSEDATRWAAGRSTTSWPRPRPKRPPVSTSSPRA